MKYLPSCLKVHKQVYSQINQCNLNFIYITSNGFKFNSAEKCSVYAFGKYVYFYLGYVGTNLLVFSGSRRINHGEIARVYVCDNLLQLLTWHQIVHFNT